MLVVRAMWRSRLTAKTLLNLRTGRLLVDPNLGFLLTIGYGVYKKGYGEGTGTVQYLSRHPGGFLSFAPGVAPLCALLFQAN